MIQRVFLSRPTLALLVFCVAFCVGCSEGPYSAEMSELKTLQDSLRTCRGQLSAIPIDSIVAAKTWADGELNTFEVMLSDSGMSLSKDEGLIIAEISRAKRLLKDFPDRIQRIDQSIDRAMNQMHDLAELLTQQAPQDAAGNYVDSAYIRQNVSRELRIARDIVRSVSETEKYALRGDATVEAVQGQADSLKTVLRARLAHLVLGRSDENGNGQP